MSNQVYPSLIKGLTWTVTKTPNESTIVQKSAGGGENRVANQVNPLWKWQLIYEYLYDQFYSANNTEAYTPQTDLRTLMGFWLARYGQFDDFLFDDPSDDWIGPQTWKALWDFNPGTVIIDSGDHKQTWSGGKTGATIPTFNHSGGTVADGQGTWQDGGTFSGASGQAIQLVNDGMPTPIYYSPIQRNMGGLFLEDVTDLNQTTNPLRVWSNGTLKTLSSDYTVNGPGLSLPGFASSGLYLTWLTTPSAPITIAANFYFRVRFGSDAQDFEQFMQQLWTIGGSGGKNGSGTLELVTARPVAV